MCVWPGAARDRCRRPPRHRVGRALTLLLRPAVLAALATPSAVASPNLPLDDPDYVELSRLRAVGLLSAHTGGVRPLTEARVQALLGRAGAPPDPAALSPGEQGLWFRPVRRLAERLLLVQDHPRPYSTSARPRQIVGEVSAFCERQDGRPCGDGAGSQLEIDPSIGWGQWLSASTRLRLTAGSGRLEPNLALDRAYLGVELERVGFQAGRDVLVLGPSARTQLMWGTNAPPLDHARVSTARPLELGGPAARLSGLYFLGRLRDPQRFEGTLLSGVRLQLDLFGRLELGGSQLLQLGGEGAPSVGFLDFLAEHFRRKDVPGSGGVGLSNRRVSFDAAATIPNLGGTRIYYEMASEDWRRQVGQTLVYDTDHLVGFELDALGQARRHALLVELQKTGIRSHEHELFTTGLTNGGRVVGSPLGPDAWSLFIGGRIGAGRIAGWPWIELGRWSSDRYVFPPVDGGHAIERSATGPKESRVRVGLTASAPVRDGLRLSLTVLAEHVDGFAFEPAQSRDSVGGEVVVIWAPSL